MAIVSAVFAVIGLGVGISERNKAARKQEAAEKLNRRQTDLENQRRIRQSVAQARVQRANALAQAAAGGVEDSSALEGALGSQATQLASNVGFAEQRAAANARSNRFIQSANRDLNRAATFQAIGQLPSQFGFGNFADAGKQIKAARAAGENPFGFGFRQT